MGLLDGKKGIIYGVRNERSIAWGCAESLAREGAKFALTYFGEREEKDVRKLAATLPEGAVPLIAPCDLTKQDQIDTLHEQLATTFETIDFMVHSVAFAKGLAGRLVDLSAGDFDISMLSSTYTFIAAAKAAEALMPNGGAMVTMTFLGGERVFPSYNTAGLSKAALESSVRYMANDLGPKGIRVNAISAGATNTLSIRGIAGARDMLTYSAKYAPLRHATTPDEVGDACAFLVSNWSRGITGDVIFVDSGYHVIGMPVIEKE